MAGVHTAISEKSANSRNHRDFSHSTLFETASQITADDLLALIADGEPQGRTIDCKRGSVGDTSDAKKEYLYDVSSFANARGGYLVFGMEEANGLPTKLAGFASADADAEILGLNA